jgi:hypothetical protein
MKIIAIKTNQGGLALTTPSVDSLNEEGLANLASKVLSTATKYKIIDSNQLPLVDAMFFDCIEYDALVPNISLAKTIWYDAFRQARAPLLAALDIEFMRAVESGDTALQSEIAGKKQALRDVTSIELPDTLEGIKATWPEILGQNPFS